MLILEETVPITIKTFFICKHTFLERKLVICLHRLDHILDFRTVCPNILDSGCSDFARNAGQVFYAFTELPDDEVFRSSRVVNL